MYIIERKNSLSFTLVYVMTLALSRLHTFFVRVSLKMVLRSLNQWGLVLQGTNNITSFQELLAIVHINLPSFYLKIVKCDWFYS